MKIRNQRIWSDDQEFLKGLAEDYAFIGRRCRLERGLLTVFALPPRKAKKKVDKPRKD